MSVPGSRSAESPDHSASIEELRAVACSFSSHPDLIANLEALLSQHVGVEVRHVKSEPIIPPPNKLDGYIKHRRTQTLHWLRVADGARIPGRMAGAVRDGCLGVFVKASKHIRNLPVDALLNGVDSADARLPFYFGSFDAADRTVAVWEAVDGEHIPFGALSPELERKLMYAIAELNAVPAADFAKILADVTRWVLAPFDYYEDLYSARFSADQREEWRSAFADTASLVGDGELAARVDALGGGFLTHNDFNPNNVLFLTNGEVAIFDWEGASLSFPGADLRLLTRLPRNATLLDHYMDRTHALGVNVGRADVIAGYSIAEGMRLVYKGWGVMNLRQVGNGLALVRNVLDN